jgi:hypothetical protein
MTFADMRRLARSVSPRYGSAPTRSSMSWHRWTGDMLKSPKKHKTRIPVHWENLASPHPNTGNFPTWGVAGFTIRVYHPKCWGFYAPPQLSDFESLNVVGLAGFEPAASSSRTKRSTKLSHSPFEGSQSSSAPRWVNIKLCSCLSRLRRLRGKCAAARLIRTRGLPPQADALPS